MACNCKFDVPLEKCKEDQLIALKCNSFALHFQNSQVILKENLPEVMDGNKGDDETDKGNRTE